MVLVVKNPPANAGDARDVSLISGLGRSGEDRNGNLLGYSWLGNDTDKGAWWATVHGVANSRIRLSMLTLLASETPRGLRTSFSYSCLLQKTLAGRKTFLWNQFTSHHHVSQYLFLLISRHRFERPPCFRHFLPLTFLFSAILSSVLLFFLI